MELLLLPSFILGCVLTYIGLRPEINRLEAINKELQGRENFRLGYKPVPTIKDAPEPPERPQEASEPLPDLLEIQKRAYYED